MEFVGSESTTSPLTGLLGLAADDLTGGVELIVSVPFESSFINNGGTSRLFETIIDEGLGRASGELGVGGPADESKPFNDATLRLWRLLSLSDDFLSGKGFCTKSREGDGVCRV